MKMTSLLIFCIQGIENENNLKKIISLLISEGINLDIQDNDGCTALMKACYHWKNEEIFRMLVDSGSDLNIQDNDGWTVLMLSCCLNIKEAVQILIDAGCNLDIRDNYGETALAKTCHCCSEVVLQMLENATSEELHWWKPVIVVVKWFFRCWKMQHLKNFIGGNLSLL